MQKRLETYLDNLKRVNSLTRPKLSPDMSGDEVLEKIHAGSEQVGALREEDDRILDEALWSRKPEDLSPEDVADLKESAQTLLGKAGGGADIGVAYAIHRLLLAYAELHGDRDLTIEESYWNGVSLHYLQGVGTPNLLGERIYANFQRGVSFLPQYDQIERLSIRSYIIRCLGNLKLDNPDVHGRGDPFVKPSRLESFPAFSKLFDRIMAVIDSPEYRAKDPEIPWDAFAYSVHMAMTVNLIALREVEETCPGTHPEIVQRVLESAEYVHTHPSARISELTRVEAEYRYLAARFHARLGSAGAVVRAMLDDMAWVNRSDYSTEGITDNLSQPIYAKEYFRFCTPAEKAELWPRLQQELEAVKRYVLHFSSDHFNFWLGKNVSELMVSGVFGIEGLEDYVLHFLLYCHIPTYVHSRMVSELSAIFMAELCVCSPEALVGVLGTKSAEEVRARREELVETARSCGLYHDLGKSRCINYVTIYGRKLLDEEFSFIKLHPVMGYNLLKGYPILKAEAEVALRHHMSYDEKGGYWPGCPPCPPEYKALVDIVTVADSTDAATDGVGRSYAQAKTLSRLVDELRAGSGTRYSPAVVALFNRKPFFEFVEQELNALRRRTYGEAYLQAMGT